MALGNTGVLADRLMSGAGAGLRAKQAALVVLGIAALAVAAQIKVPMWPVAISMGTFAVLSIGAAYGPGLGLVTILGYMAVGAMGFDVFQRSATGARGLTYMMGGTGGYLLGYVLAVMVLGAAARAGWNCSIGRTALAMLVASAVIYVPGLLWLGNLYGWDQPILAWGLWPFLVGDVLKLGLAALLISGLSKWVKPAQD